MHACRHCNVTVLFFIVNLPAGGSNSVLPEEGSGLIRLMLQLHMVTWVACRQEQGGTRAAERENEVGGRKKAERERESSGLPFRHPNKSGLFCCCLCSAYTKSKAALGI